MKPTILFLCTGNSCRSQMAEGWAKSLKKDILIAYSAGIETHGLNPYAIQVMQEAGIDITTHESKHVDSLADIDFDYVITVCDHAHESCPVFSGNAKIVPKSFEDPPKLAENAKTEEEKLCAFRKVRDEIKEFIKSLPESLT